MRYSLIALCTGFLLDFILGDPNYFWHPIRLIGKLIAFIEKLLRKMFPKTKQGELVGGIFLLCIVLGISTVIPVLILSVTYHLNLHAGIVLESVMCYQLLATKSLKVESGKVYKALKTSDIEAGRSAVSMIVGRDTKNLTESGIIKAAVETVAENTSDGSIAPLFYMVIGGAGLGFFYKAVNTMDSMVGYKNERYLYFGKTAARMDDVLNYIPARMSAYIMILGTGFTKYSTRKAWKIYRRDRYNHASPNSAHTEAVVAGALEVQLAGDAYYFGKLYPKKTIGDDIRTVEVEDIKKANDLLYITAIIGMIIFGGMKLLILTILS
jgi:adenosylcobinamide-phosphate synthase